MKVKKRKLLISFDFVTIRATSLSDAKYLKIALRLVLVHKPELLGWSIKIDANFKGQFWYRNLRASSEFLNN